MFYYNGDSPIAEEGFFLHLYNYLTTIDGFLSIIGFVGLNFLVVALGIFILLKLIGASSKEFLE